VTFNRASLILLKNLTIRKLRFVFSISPTKSSSAFPVSNRQLSPVSSHLKRFLAAKRLLKTLTFARNSGVWDEAVRKY
jgi:hypothetical protein